MLDVTLMALTFINHATSNIDKMSKFVFSNHFVGICPFALWLFIFIALDVICPNLKYDN